MGNHTWNSGGQWREIEASLGGRFNEGKECPRYVAELYQLAQADAEGQPDHPDAKSLRGHLASCPVCRLTYESALEVAEREVAGVPTERGLDTLLLPEEVRSAPGIELETAEAAFSYKEIETGEAVSPLVSKARGSITLTILKVLNVIALKFARPVFATAVIVFITAAVLVALVVNDNAKLRASNAKQEDDIRSLRTRLDALQHEIEALGLPNPVALYDLRIADRDRIEVAGEFNSTFIKEIRVRWGTEKEDVLYTGRPEPDPHGGRKTFSRLSPEFKLNSDPIAVTLEFVPYPEMSKRFPHYFRPDQMQYSRNFLLARDGIKADPQVAEILTPKEGAKVQRFDEVEGKLNTKRGWPVVLVRAVNDNDWWVQSPVEEVEGGAFTVPAFFGSPNTEPGTKFRVVIVVAKNKEEAHNRYRASTTIALPSGLPRSKSITVTRE